jgi:DNA-binding LytR/AlgR family response regulator
MKTIIIEDELLNAQGLEKLLLKLKPEAKVLEVLDSVQNAVDWFTQHEQPDLVFMDIQLSDGLSFEIFDKVEVTAPIIFTTAYDKYAIHAFRVNSIDYLLKPINKDDLQNALKKLERLYNSTSLMQEQIKLLIKSVHQKEKQFNERFLVHDKGGMAPVPADDVAYFIKESIIYLVTNDNQKLVTDYNTLDELEELVNPVKFFRANRQMLLHKNQVSNYKKHYTGKMTVHIKIDPKLEVDVSREKSHEFLNWLEH